MSNIVELLTDKDDKRAYDHTNDLSNYKDSMVPLIQKDIAELFNVMNDR